LPTSRRSCKKCCKATTLAGFLVVLEVSLIVRLATPADVAEIVRISNLAFRVEDFFIDGDRTDAADVASKMANENACFMVIEDAAHRALLASAYVEIRGPRGYFAMLAVDPARQNAGLGRRLFNAIEAHCRAAGCSAIDISVVNLRTELPSFYAKLGFEVTGVARLTTHTLKRDAHFVLMSKRLDETGRAAAGGEGPSASGS
jgi:ribosomal protein S18 acetylase RimI-like enzyme